MHWCVACGRWGAGPLCAPCRRSLTTAPAASLVPGIEVRPALLHTGAARLLVHRLKYRGMRAAAPILAAAMAVRIPGEAAVLVPVPRAVARRWRYGIDPATELARAVAARTGLPLCRALAPALWWPRHAGAPRSMRGTPQFRLRFRPPGHVVVIDDVLTSGATVAAATAILGTPVSAVTATASSVPLQSGAGPSDGVPPGQ